jgi:hypothetical protein
MLFSFNFSFTRFTVSSLGNGFRYATKISTAIRKSTVVRFKISQWFIKMCWLMISSHVSGGSAYNPRLYPSISISYIPFRHYRYSVQIYTRLYIAFGNAKNCLT